MKLHITLLLALPCSLVLATRAQAQGSNDCATATAISGTGMFGVSTLGATDSPQQTGSCTPAHNDVWFAWTATATGNVTISMCGGASTDTVLAVYPGSACPAAGTQLACNDDFCGLQSQVSIGATGGSVYMIQIGEFNAGVTYTGTLTITAAPPPTNNDDCSLAIAISGTGTFPVDTTGATDSAQQPGGCPTVHDDVWFQWTATASELVAVSLCAGASVDTVLAVYPGSTCPVSGTQITCNDDFCALQSQVAFAATAGNTYMIQIGEYGSGATFVGTFTIGQPPAGGCSPPSVGPDVIVGDIVGVLNAAAAGGLDALALGTGACNIGDTTVNWFAPNNLHPVIGSTLYRYKIVNGAGRFEEVGMSWLKHGFGAATDSLCCSCVNPGNSQLLGIGCSDTYDAALNGTQAPLGPRWQVNAHTGVFAFPPANPSWSGSTARRCEVALSDLEVSGVSARYFAECLYTTQDDAAAGNNDNNASFREMTVTGGPADFTFATTGLTTRMQPAIRAWALVEPGVMVTNVQVPGDGLFVVGSHATSLGGGQYHYEYAVYDMNADRNCGTFSVAIPAGVSVTNIGFHDVTYRNGDGPGNVNFDGTDWTPALAGGVLTWSTQTQAQNASANAIRWSSTYNFRFDANVAPASGDVVFGLWKSGTPAAMSAAAQVPGGGATTFAYCYGDGSGTPCPCGNNSAIGADAGCLNSLGTGGALTTSGNASVSADTFVLQGSGMTNSSSLYFQGTTQQNGRSGSAFGDGLRCAGGAVVRLGIKTNASGSSQYPAAGDPTISSHAGDAPGDVRTYQCWYRNAASFCQPDTFNLTNGIQTTWVP